jgi:hypothetical protein
MKSIWFIIALGFSFINASENKKFKKMIIGQYISFDYLEILLAKVTAQPGEKFEFEEFSVLNDDESDKWRFTMANYKINIIKFSLKYSLSLRQNGNIHVYDGKIFTQVLYKFPDECDFEQVKKSLKRLMRSKKYQQPSSSLPIEKRLEYNQKFLQEHLTEIFTDYHVVQIMTKKIVKQDPSFLSPPQSYDQKYPTLLHCGFCLVIVGLLCLLVVHPYLFQPLPTPPNENTSTDTSFVNQISVSEDTLKSIYVEPRYLSSSTMSISNRKLSSKNYTLFMNQEFQSISTSTEMSNDAI